MLGVGKWGRKHSPKHQKSGICLFFRQFPPVKIPQVVDNQGMNSVFTAEKDIQGMREAGRLASEVLDHVAPHVKAGVTTGELDRICHEYMRDVQKTIPAPLNYQPPGYPPFPASICTSVNDVICHGIPGEKVLKSGDVVNLDITVITQDGYYGDTSRMFMVGDVSVMAKRLTQITFECMWLGIAQVKPGASLGDIGHYSNSCRKSRLLSGSRILRPWHRQSLPPRSTNSSLWPPWHW